jgi:outer membrane lipoprotein SlyB
MVDIMDHPHIRQKRSQAMQTLQPLQPQPSTPTARPKLLYPAMVVAAIAVTLFSLLGIATMTGLLPQAHSAADPAGNRLADNRNSPANGQAAMSDTDAPTGNRAGTVAPHSCSTCGTVESISLVESKGQGSGVGAVVGGIAGALLGNTMGQGNGRTAMTLVGAGGGAYAGNEIEKNTHKSSSYRIRVRLEHGGLRTVYQRSSPSVAVGDRVKVVNGAVVQQS